MHLALRHLTNIRRRSNWCVLHLHRICLYGYKYNNVKKRTRACVYVWKGKHHNIFLNVFMFYFFFYFLVSVGTILKFVIYVVVACMHFRWTLCIGWKYKFLLKNGKNQHKSRGIIIKKRETGNRAHDVCPKLKSRPKSMI